MTLTTHDTGPIQMIGRPVVTPGDLARQYSAALVLAEALRHADDRHLPGPVEVTVDHTGAVDVVMADMEGVLAWQPQLAGVTIADLTLTGGIAIRGERGGNVWTVRTAAL